MNCLIVGASVGIGHDLALKLASKKYNLMLTYNTNYELCKKLQEKIIKQYRVKCIIKKCDLRIEDNIKETIEDCKSKLGRLDVLVNNASISHDNLIDDKTKDEFLDVIDVNLIGTFLMCKYGKNIMSKKGIIINMSSTDGIDTYSIYNIDYAISKAGIIQLTKSLSLILDNIKVIAIAPNWVDTESTRQIDEKYLQNELLRVGQKKLITISEVVNTIVHSIENLNMKSGSIIRIDGE